MATSNRVHLQYGIGLVPIDYYLLNRNDSKKLIECCLKEGWIIKDFTHIDDKDRNVEGICQELKLVVSEKNIFVHLNKRAPIVNVLDKGLMAFIEILKIDG